MGYVVCHIEKPKGNDAGTSAHIERRVHPANADQSREHLNQKLVEYPDGGKNRTQAITHRIETAGITRKVGTNQVRALRVIPIFDAKLTAVLSNHKMYFTECVRARRAHQARLDAGPQPIFTEDLSSVIVVKISFRP